MDVVAVPRLHYVKAAKRRKREQRPSQALFNPVKCANTFGRKSVTTVFASDGVDVVGHVFRNHQYDRAGYVVLKDLPQGHYTPVDRASRAKYILFNNCVAVSVSDLHTSMKVLENRSLRRSDKVRVLDGVFRGMVGTVEDVHLHHLSVILPNTVFDGLLEVPIESVTRSFALGDHVLVNTGERKGAQGYVVSTDNGCDTITIQSIKPEVTYNDSCVINFLECLPYKPYRYTKLSFLQAMFKRYCTISHLRSQGLSPRRFRTKGKQASKDTCPRMLFYKQTPSKDTAVLYNISMVTVSPISN